jgi:dihydroorotase-like cyclic amidohydrolase
MAKVALVSRHIVYLKARIPVYGVILVDGELIKDIVIAEPTVSVATLLETYADWNPIDLEDYFISPGLIDINVRREWETLSYVTQSALSGGVTMVVEETSLYNRESQQDSELYCDVGRYATVSSAAEVESSPSGVYGYKAYLFPPSPSTRAVEDLSGLVQAVATTNLPLIIDAVRPTMRLFHETSPCHFMRLEDRLSATDLTDSKIFAAAFPDEADDSDVEEEPEEMTKISRTQSNSYSDEALNRPIPAMTSSLEEVKHEDEMPQVNLSQRKRLQTYGDLRQAQRHPSTSHDIFSSLDQRIRVGEQSIESLSKVEQFTYAKSGPTTFSSAASSINSSPLISATLSPPMKPSTAGPSTFRAEALTLDCGPFNTLGTTFSLCDIGSINSPLPDTDSPSTPKSALLGRLASRRPFKLHIEKKSERASATEDSSSLYMFYLANFPDQWEVSGVTKVIKAIGSSTCRVHVTCLSSASAVNKVRKAQQSCKITCEVAASCLYYTDSDVPRGDTRFKSFPPIRSRANLNLLWDLLKMKGIHSLTSQHRGVLPPYKLGVQGSLKRAISGFNGIGFTLQQIWTKLRLPCTCNEDLEHYIVRLAKWLSLHPAKVLGVDKSRGSIEQGKLADFVIWDPHKQIRVKKSYSQFNETCLLVGADLYGKVHKVMLRGKFVLDNDKFTRGGRRVFNTDA